MTAVTMPLQEILEKLINGDAEPGAVMQSERGGLTFTVLDQDHVEVTYPDGTTEKRSRVTLPETL